ncbi:MAG: O-methyltransferase [Bacteroidia bacterium]|nr:O-methyltransferase [Bacteroidia bacterium]
MDFLDPAIEQYVIEHTQAEPDILQRLNRETNLKVLMPRMLSGHLQGRVLHMLSCMIKPKHILEIGTYTGYSAICLASGLVEGGKLITIDINSELEKMVRKYFDEAGVAAKIDYRIGNAMTIIPGVKEKLDLVFIDADKENYSNYYDLVFDKVNKGGFIIADNVLWSGKVLMDKAKMDKDTKAICEFNNKVHNDKRVEHVLFPVRDGLMVVRKISE